MRSAARAMLLVGGVVVVGILAQLLFSSLIAPQLLIKKIVVNGDFPLSSVELKSIAGLDGTDHIFDVNTQAIAERLTAHSLIQSASVRTRVPGTLEVNLVRRQPLAMSVATIEGRSVAVVFDASGVIIEVDPARAPELPILSGLEFAEQPRPAMNLPADLLPTVASLASIRDNEPSLYSLISEILVSTTDAGVIDLSFYPSVYPVSVRLGRHLDIESIKHALVALDVLNVGDASGMPLEIDFRAGEAVYVIPASPRAKVTGPEGRSTDV